MDEESNLKTNRVVVLLDDDELDYLKILAEDLGLSNSSYLRQLIQRQFRENYISKSK